MSFFKGVFLNILFIEPFYEGSHKYFADAIKKYSKHNIILHTLKGRHWKWRMQTSSVYFANLFSKLTIHIDLIVATDMLDVAHYLALIRNLGYRGKCVTYFHENQLTYPWSGQNKKDLTYGIKNYLSCLACDICLFNSAYNLNSFLTTLEKTLKIMPDAKNLDSIKKIESKSIVMPLGIELEPYKALRKPKDSCHILWNHRFEYDKNPVTFFTTLYKLKDFPFRLYILGQESKNMPPIFKEAKSILKNHIEFFGRIESRRDYISTLKKCHLIPVTTNQEFFGISVMEAVYYGAHPILPNRLTFPELFNIDKNPDLFYSDEEKLLEKTRYAINNFNSLESYSHLASPYSWDKRISHYDRLFDSI